MTSPTLERKKAMTKPGKDEPHAMLKGAGESPRLATNDAGATVMVLPNGGRVLGLFSPESQTNYLWTSDHLHTAGEAREFMAGDRWQNSGGDRTWLGPEIEFFYPKYPRTDP